MLSAHRILAVIVTAALGFVPVFACRSAPDVPEQTGEGPVEPNSDAAVQQAEKEKKEPVELEPVGLGGGPQDESTASVSTPPKPTATVKPKPAPTTKPSGAPTFTLPWPSTVPSWWPFPSSTPSGADAGKDWAKDM